MSSLPKGVNVQTMGAKIGQWMGMMNRPGPSGLTPAQNSPGFADFVSKSMHAYQGYVDDKQSLYAENPYKMTPMEQDDFDEANGTGDYGPKSSGGYSGGLGGLGGHGGGPSLYGGGGGGGPLYDDGDDDDDIFDQMGGGMGGGGGGGGVYYPGAPPPYADGDTRRSYRIERLILRSHTSGRG